MKTVLVVEDEFGLAEALSAMLSDEGYRVIVAGNGQQVRDQIGEISPDLILLDFMMPVLNGAAALKALRKNPRYAALPIVLMSGVARGGRAQRLRRVLGVLAQALRRLAAPRVDRGLIGGVEKP